MSEIMVISTLHFLTTADIAVQLLILELAKGPVYNSFVTRGFTLNVLYGPYGLNRDIMVYILGQPPSYNHPQGCNAVIMHHSLIIG